MKWILLAVVLILTGCGIPMDCADCDRDDDAPISGPSIGVFTFGSSISGVRFFELIGIGDAAGGTFTPSDEIDQAAEYQLSPGDARILWTYTGQAGQPDRIITIGSAAAGNQRVYDLIFLGGELTIYDWFREFE